MFSRNCQRRRWQFQRFPNLSSRLMFRLNSTLFLTLACIAQLNPCAAECLVEIVSGAPEGVDKSIMKQLEARHVKLRRNGEFDLCEIWIARSWSTRGKLAKSNPEADSPLASVPIDYDLLPGSLVGVLKVTSPCLDLRQQEIPTGTYTLRYAVQPAYECHRESHESRDFVLLLSPKVDRSPDPIGDSERMFSSSAEAVETGHPAFLPMVKPLHTSRGDALRRDNRDPDGWILLLKGHDERGKSTPLEIIVPYAASPG